MRKMFSEKQIENIAQQVAPSEEEIKDLAWESVSQDHATDLVEPIIDTVNYGIQEGLIQAGGKVYRHKVSLIRKPDSGNLLEYSAVIIIYNSSSTPITKDNITNYLPLSTTTSLPMTTGDTSSCFPIPCFGLFRYSIGQSGYFYPLSHAIITSDGISFRYTKYTENVGMVWEGTSTYTLTIAKSEVSDIVEEV